MMNNLKCDKSLFTFGFIILIIMIVLGVNIFLDYNDKELETQEYHQQIERINSAEWAFVETTILENYDKAKIQGQSVANNLTEKVNEAYADDPEQLKADINHATSESKLTQIARNEIDKKYLNVDNDNNDIFVASRVGIISDKSLNCSYYTESRNWTQETDMHWNKELANTAINSLINLSDKNIFWEFLPPTSPDHMQIVSMDLEEVHKVFLAEGYKGIKGYEFLQPVYITDDGDIFGNKDVLSNGTKNNTYKVIVVQGFNIVDLINSKYVKDVDEFAHMRSDAQKEHESYIAYKSLRIILMSTILIIAFIGIAKIQHLHFSTTGG